ncbi:MAG: hypothetical protein ACYCO3_05585 [Mycobacteriales bacterium]
MQIEASVQPQGVTWVHPGQAGEQEFLALADRQVVHEDFVV